MRTIKESDWKLLQKVHKVALERFSRRAVANARLVISDQSSSYHQRYGALHELLQLTNNDMAYLFDDLRRSTAIACLVALKSADLMTQQEFDVFSEETRAIVNLYFTSRLIRKND